MNPATTETPSRRYARIRSFSERLVEPLEVEDFGIQSMPDASPVKWHLAHATWFFETFVLRRYVPAYRAFREPYLELFNSYYEAVGPRPPRPERGLLSRPTVREVFVYRRAIDDAMSSLFERSPSPELLATVELGMQHEQQHQELILTDILHAFSKNPLKPAYARSAPPVESAQTRANAISWIPHEGGVFECGHSGSGFAFDNETPAHRVLLDDFSLADRHVSAGEFSEFIADRGYERPELWLSDGFSAARSEGWAAPLYWERRDGQWWSFSLYGMQPVDLEAPVSHVSYYEADAFARWAGARLPAEFEWEVAARSGSRDGQFVDDGVFVPARRATSELFGGVWVWTKSPYSEYPGFHPLAGALGEYNGKFMVNQLVLRGGSCFSSRDHLRHTYRNFFPPAARWQMSGVRLGR